MRSDQEKSTTPRPKPSDLSALVWFGTDVIGDMIRRTMATAILITLEKPLPDAQAIYVKSKTGKALFRESSRLDLAARTEKVAPLTDFLSENSAELIEQMKAEGFDVTKMRIPPERWFPAAEGLAAIRKLIPHVTANLNNFKQPNPILKDLRAAEQLLIAAETAGVKFHTTQREM